MLRYIVVLKQLHAIGHGPNLQAPQLAKHIKVLFNSNMLPSEITLSLHCCDWCPTQCLLSKESLSSSDVYLSLSDPFFIGSGLGASSSGMPRVYGLMGGGRHIEPILNIRKSSVLHLPIESP